MSRIAELFKHCQNEHRKALVIFVSVGNPDLKTSEKIITAAIAAGADIIELGVPFSDPMADGPVIQRAGQRALANGTTVGDVLATARRLRKQTAVPLILFSYYNVIYAYGVEKMAADSAAAGIDGWLVVDLPLEEADEVKPALKKHGLSLIPLLAPTTTAERAAKILRDADGFAYYITVTGVTGARKKLTEDPGKKLRQIKKLSPVPVVAGFGIATPAMAEAAARHGDGVVVGSALVSLSEKYHNAEELCEQSGKLVAAIARSLISKKRKKKE